MTKYYYYFDSPVGRLYIAEWDSAITDISFRRINSAVYKKTPLLSRAIVMLREYFNGKRKVFDLPLLMLGTEFQKKAWNALLTIPYGQTRSYKEQAEIMGIKAYRAVGAANGENPVSIVVPCHRVIGSDGSLVGYGGGLDTKQALLDLEKKYS